TTFRLPLTPAQETALAEASRRLAAPGRSADAPSANHAQSRTNALGRGETATVARLEGRGAIAQFDVRFPEKPSRELLRALVLRIRFDGEPGESVWAPLGDFFGTAPGENPFASLPLGVARDRYYCDWYMPYTNGAFVDVTNEGNA